MEHGRHKLLAALVMGPRLRGDDSGDISRDPHPMQSFNQTGGFFSARLRYHRGEPFLGKEIVPW
jgi:hypothetical protein